MVWGSKFAELLRTAVSRALKRVLRRSKWDLALGMGKAWGSFTFQWKDWKAG